MNQQGETWINNGLNYVKADRCPFCGQSLAGVELVKAYRAFFSKAYAALKDEISQMSSKVAFEFSQDAILKLQRTIDINSSNTEFWKGYVKADYPKIEFDNVQRVWMDLKSPVEQHLKRKEASPLESIELGETLRQAFTASDRIAESVLNYNNKVEGANILIAEKKRKTAGADQNLSIKSLRN